MPKQKTPILVPFDKRGNLMSYVLEYQNERGDVEWRENFVLETTLTWKDFYRGRSSPGIKFTDSDGREYPMFLKDLGELLLNSTMVKGKVTGKFTFCKRGENYGIKYVAEEMAHN